MEYKYLNTLYNPSDLKALPQETLPRVCEEVRDFIKDYFEYLNQ